MELQGTLLEIIHLRVVALTHFSLPSSFFFPYLLRVLDDGQFRHSLSRGNQNSLNLMICCIKAGEGSRQR